MEHTPGENLLVWEFDFALTTFFEVETDLFQQHIPSRLSLMEVAPGVGLVNITAFNFPKGALGELPQFQELIFSAIVSPDLSRGVPKFAMYVLSLGSTCQEHLDHSADYYKLPIHGLLTDTKIDSEAIAIDYSDSDGQILAMNNCSPTTKFRDEERYFQAFTSDGDNLTIADCYIEAQLFEHQLTEDAGKLNVHPFLKNIDFDLGDPLPYLQMIGEPGKIGKQFYYRPSPF